MCVLVSYISLRLKAYAADKQEGSTKKQAAPEGTACLLILSGQALSEAP